MNLIECDVILQKLDINLIMTDYCMPEMTGYDLLKRVKVERLYLPDNFVLGGHICILEQALEIPVIRFLKCLWFTVFVQ